MSAAAQILHNLRHTYEAEGGTVCDEYQRQRYEMMQRYAARLIGAA